MRFRFCGDLDAPDWLLAEIATLSRISSVRMKILVKQIIGYLLEGHLSYEKITKLAGEGAEGVSDLKGSVAAIHFIVKQAAKFDTDEFTLLQEIQQLGLPKENGEAITRQYREAKDALQRVLQDKSYRMSKLVGAHWRVDQVLCGSEQDSDEVTTTGTTVHVKFILDTRPQDALPPTSNPDGARIQEIACETSAEKLQILIYELQKAHRIMEAVEG